MTEKHHKKKRFMWDAPLHGKFIAAIFDVGLTHVTAEEILELGSQSNRQVTPSAITEFMATMQRFRSELRECDVVPIAPIRRTEPVSIKPQPTSRPRKPRTVVSRASDPSMPVLSAEALLKRGHDQYLFKEFPHLKDPHHHVHLPPPNSFASDPTPNDVTRPFSPISSEIETYDFDWERETYDSSVIKLYLDC